MGEPLVPYTVQGGKNFDEIFRKQKPGAFIPVEFEQLPPTRLDERVKYHKLRFANTSDKTKRQFSDADKLINDLHTALKKAESERDDADHDETRG